MQDDYHQENESPQKTLPTSGWPMLDHMPWLWPIPWPFTIHPLGWVRAANLAHPKRGDILLLQVLRHSSGGCDSHCHGDSRLPFHDSVSFWPLKEKLSGWCVCSCKCFLTLWNLPFRCKRGRTQAEILTRVAASGPRCFVCIFFISRVIYHF